MKLLFVTNLCPQYRVKLFELLGEMYDIEFLFYARKERLYDGENFMGRFRGEYLEGIKVLPKVTINPRLIKKLLFDDYTHVIKCVNGPVPLLACFAFAKLRRKKFILWTGIWHHPQTLFHKRSFPFIKYLYRHSDAVAVYGPHVKRYLTSLGVPPEKITVAWQTQDQELFARAVSDEERHEKRRELNISTPHLMLFVGRLAEQKGIRVLLEAFRSLHGKDVSLLVIGRGPLEVEVKNAAQAHDQIRHIPRVAAEDLYLYYAIADVLVLPSVTTDDFREPWGFVVNEAMYQGCAVITSDAVGAGVGGLIEEGRNGFIVPENDARALAQAIEQVFGDPEALLRMKNESREIIRQWTYPRMAEGFTQALAVADGLDHDQAWAIRESSNRQPTS